MTRHQTIWRLRFDAQLDHWVVTPYAQRMARPSTLYRFRIELSDIDRGIYGQVDLRVAMHPSETEAYLLTRVLAYCLNYSEEEALEVTPGLCTADEPALFRRDTGPAGGIALWIDIGNPAPARLHKASKAARGVKVYTYKNPDQILREAEGERIHRASEIEILALEPQFIDALVGKLGRDNEWTLTHQEGSLIVGARGETIMGSVSSIRLSSP